MFVVSDLQLQEDTVIDELRLFCDGQGREIHPVETARLLHRLGKLYRQRSPDKLSLLQSAALFNAAIVRNPGNAEEVRNDLKELCFHVLKLSKAQHPNEDLIEAAKCLSEKVKEMRENALLELQNAPLRSSFDSLKDYELQKTEFVQNLQNHITSDYVELMKSVSDCSLQAIGDAPCQYSHVALGSLARKEVTPFSDFESIILLQEGVQRSIEYPNILDYFRWFTIILQIIILNFGETIIPSVAIPSLNDFTQNGKDWFFDVHTPRGISFDGLMPHASKTPLGRQQKTKKKPWKTELIKPVSQMIKYLEWEDDIKNGYHLADILATTRFVSGNPEVCEQFQSKLLQFSSNEKQFFSTRRIIEIINEDLQSFAVFDSLATAYKKMNLNTKRMIYRSSTIFISTLRKIHNLKSVSSFEIISELEEKHVITPHAAHNLKFAIAIACEVRLRTYMENKAQSESLPLHLTKSETAEDNHLDLGNIIDVKDAIEYFKITFCLQKNIRSGYQDNYHDDMRTVEKHVAAGISFCFFEYQAALDLGKSIREEYLAEAQVEKVAAFTSFIKECLYLLGRFSEALDEIRYELSLEFKFQPPNLKSIAKCHQDAAKCLLKLEQQIEAAKEFEKELNVRKQMQGNMFSSEDILLCLKNIANANFSCSEFKIALKWFQEEKREYETRASLARHCHDLSKCYGNIGGCLFKLQQYEDAFHYYKLALANTDAKLLEEIAFFWNKIGHCLFKLNKAEEALNSYKKELQVLQQLRGGDTKKEDCINNIATCLRILGKQEEAAKFEKKLF